METRPACGLGRGWFYSATTGWTHHPIGGRTNADHEIKRPPSVPSKAGGKDADPFGFPVMLPRPPCHEYPPN